MTGRPCAVSRSYGQGIVYYFGSRLGSGAVKDGDGFLKLIERICEAAGVSRTLNISTSEENMLFSRVLRENGQNKFLAMISRSDKPLQISIKGKDKFRGLFSGMNLSPGEQTTIDLSPGFADLFIVE